MGEGHKNYREIEFEYSGIAPGCAEIIVIVLALIGSCLAPKILNPEKPEHAISAQIEATRQNITNQFREGANK
ncbi:hypothetical protein HZA38_00905 [Candidatus Peregrinibacteria bacterium]|nr:hypothetical protein [Candidatus Peregrinibacteria bacterium]